MAVTKYDNIISMGDININLDDEGTVGFHDLLDFMDVFSLKNLITDITCFSKGHASSIDVILTNNIEYFTNLGRTNLV